MAKLLDWLEGKLGGGPSGPKRVKTFQWLILLGLAGTFLVILNSFIQVKTVQSPNAEAVPDANQQVFLNTGNDPDSPFSDYENSYSMELKQILEKIVGVGNVEVMTTIDSTAEIIVYRNMRDTQSETSERDGKGATRHITDVTRSGEIVLYEVSGGQAPIILKTIKPKIRGVLIVANGAENAAVKKMLLEAVQRGLDVPPHRISILPRKQQ